LNLSGFPSRQRLLVALLGCFLFGCYGDDFFLLHFPLGLSFWFEALELRIGVLFLDRFTGRALRCGSLLFLVASFLLVSLRAASLLFVWRCCIFLANILGFFAFSFSCLGTSSSPFLLF